MVKADEIDASELHRNAAETAEDMAKQPMVFLELHNDIVAAIACEKAPKAWKRAWKIELIETANPEWRDLFDEIFGRERPQLSLG